MLRLPEQKSDILITVNVPHVVGERGYDPEGLDIAAGKNGTLIDAAIGIRDELLKTFKILDWGLFGAEDEE